MTTNWKQRYDELAKYTRTLSEKVHQLDFDLALIRNHIAYSDNLDLQERNKSRFLRLKEDVTLHEYYEGNNYYPNYEGPERTFTKGTLIDATILGKRDGTGQAVVYLDNDGDGFLYFPANILEEIEIDSDDVVNHTVIHQG
jgi:hypothetical protein